MPPIASSATESATRDDAERRQAAVAAAEEPHRVVERQVRDEVAALGRLEHDAARLVRSRRASQEQQPIRDVDPARDGARLGRRPVALGQPGDGRCVRLLELRRVVRARPCGMTTSGSAAWAGSTGSEPS